MRSSWRVDPGDLSLDGEGMYSEDGSITGMLSEDGCSVESERMVIEVLIQNYSISATNGAHRLVQ